MRVDARFFLCFLLACCPFFSISILFAMIALVSVGFVLVPFIACAQWDSELLISKNIKRLESRGYNFEDPMETKLSLLSVRTPPRGGGGLRRRTGHVQHTSLP